MENLKFWKVFPLCKECIDSFFEVKEQACTCLLVKSYGMKISHQACNV